MFRKIATAAALLAPAAWGKPLADQVLSERVIDQAISAVGGEQAINALQGVAYRASR